MATIYKDGSFLSEDWQRLDAEADIPSNGGIYVPLARFLDNPAEFANRKAPVAVVVSAGDELKPLLVHLDKLSIIAVDFPNFADGRGFSTARVLREQHGFSGDIRAIGQYILDQMPLARRCGVSSFDITKPEVLKALEAGEWPEVTKYLQPVGTVDEIPEGTRPWARRSQRDIQEAAE